MRCVKQEGGADAKAKRPCGEDPEKKDGAGKERLADTSPSQSY